MVAGVATGVGSMPGLDVRAALSIVTGEVPDLIHLPELPNRGPGGEMVGRAFGVLNRLDEGLAIETTPSGWRLDRSENRVMRRAKSWLAEDLDALEAVAATSAVPVKLQLTGPFTLAASVEAVAGERLITDPGAVRNLVAAVAAAAELHLSEARRRLPLAELVLQIDEPALPSVLAGRIPTRTGRGSLPPLPAAEVERGLTEVAAAIAAAQGVAWLHCCGRPAPVALASRAGFKGLSVPMPQLSSAEYQDIGDHWDRGGVLVAGLAETTDPVGIIQRMARFTGEIGLAASAAPTAIAFSPECGLASVDPVAPLRLSYQVARGIADWPEA